MWFGKLQLLMMSESHSGAEAADVHPDKPVLLDPYSAYQFNEDKACGQQDQESDLPDQNEQSFDGVSALHQM